MSSTPCRPAPCLLLLDTRRDRCSSCVRSRELFSEEGAVALFGRDSCVHPIPPANIITRCLIVDSMSSVSFAHRSTPFPRKRRTHARLDRWHARAHRIPPHIPRHLGDVQFHTSHNPTSRWKLPASQCRVGLQTLHGSYMDCRDISADARTAHRSADGSFIPSEGSQPTSCIGPCRAPGLQGWSYAYKPP